MDDNSDLDRSNTKERKKFNQFFGSSALKIIFRDKYFNINDLYKIRIE